VARIQGLLVLLSLVLLGLAGTGNPVEILATALVIGAVLVLVLHQPRSTEPAVWVRSRTLKQRAERTTFLRTRDPDADGRVRPRAPGRSPAAA
jgi:hypothetical protein